MNVSHHLFQIAAIEQLSTHRAAPEVLQIGLWLPALRLSLTTFVHHFDNAEIVPAGVPLWCPPAGYRRCSRLPAGKQRRQRGHPQSIKILFYEFLGATKKLWAKYAASSRSQARLLFTRPPLTFQNPIIRKRASNLLRLNFDAVIERRSATAARAAEIPRSAPNADYGK
jgi:hypothetical protein